MRELPPAAPALCRTPLAPSPKPSYRPRRQHWERVLLWRRSILFALVVAPSAFMGWLFSSALPPPHNDPLDLALAAAFGLLFAWVAIWFWTAMAGFFLLLGKRRMKLPGAQASESSGTVARVAVVIPVYQEEPALVAGGIAALYEGLAERNSLERYDFFILSDSADADQWIAEEATWLRLTRELDAAGRIFYRRRRSRSKRKPGNIADFCRRWGRNYAYLIMLDADSVLAAETAEELVARMDANPSAGIIQTFPQVVNQHTLYGRLQQFAAALYGRMFTAGLHFWQLGAGMYWGHNAIIRLDAFMRHCMLPSIHGGPLGGDILSHDFVEAALMRRAGYDVWIAYDLEGSYEETPPRFADDVIRDRRWSRGNLQHLRLLGMHGLHGAHRAMFVAGAFSYISSGIWLIFLALGTAIMIQHAWSAPNYFPQAHSPFPHWPVWHHGIQIALIATAFGTLLLPKLFGWLLAILRRSSRRRFGGGIRLTIGMLIELLVSGLFAPARMLLHSFFVVAALLGARVEWGGQQRGLISIRPQAVMRRHFIGFALGALWLALALQVSLTLFFWLLPALAGLFLTPLLEIVTGSAKLGRRLRNKRILVTGEELAPPAALLARREILRRFLAAAMPGFAEVFRDAATHALHVGLLRRRRLPHGAVGYERLAAAARLLRYGPAALDAEERLRLLYDRELLKSLYRRLAEPRRGANETLQEI
ncbi:MAG TPA: glucans biosynthesis glucosyltransferase MdoH [Gammaproteobacteria bacterium]|nr:glucans biosynthesis glucosyltransferase MdoH [Gammaproteobacteria bacterium]